MTTQNEDGASSHNTPIKKKRRRRLRKFSSTQSMQFHPQPREMLFLKSLSNYGTLEPHHLTKMKLKRSTPLNGSTLFLVKPPLPNAKRIQEENRVEKVRIRR